MSGETERVDYGMTDKGNVFLLKIANNTDDGEGTVYTYQVRHGSHTVGSYPSLAKAEAVAKALVA